MKTSQEIGRETTPAGFCRLEGLMRLFEGLDLQALVTRCEFAAGATGGACDARGARRAVPLGNTGTTTVGDAQ